MSDTALRAGILMLVLILPLSALVARRVSWRKSVFFYGAIWLGIAAAIAVPLSIFT